MIKTNYNFYYMNIIFRNIVFITIAVLTFSCNKPLPTELLDDTLSEEQNLQIESASPEPSTYIYANGYDTTGILQPFFDKSTLINVSGIRNTFNNQTVFMANYSADFYDTNLAIKNMHGRLVGFRTRMMGTVKFNNITADKIPLRIRYMDNGKMIDTTIGFHFVLRNNNMMHPNDILNFPYNSFVNFRIDVQQGNHFQYNIPTPPEIIGHLKVEGTRAKKNLKIEISWNALRSGKINMVVGIFDPITQNVFPYYKITAADNGNAVLPLSLLEKLPIQGQQQLVITLIRKIEIEIQNNQLLKDNLIVSQSIHNIKVQLPN
ncbi:hypothetical protein ABRY23_05255 [Melioribacteraceae bacterium 4301-Me]|uniref:hypothetical protein n=1 Tax=Pyranulibacter aquaticus TaxID=3163344 RepID=UPI0035975424